MKRAHQNHRKSNAVEARKTNTTMRTTPKERSNALDLPTRFHLSHLILFFSLSYSIARMFLLFIDLVRILVSIPHYTVRLHNFFPFGGVVSQVFFSF